jgi:hypothetical protein
VAGVQRYPWLAELLPAKPATAVSCTTCHGQGQIAQGAFCYSCNALGWRTPPVFVPSADGDLRAFESCEEAESWMESDDVEGGEYVAGFDAVGTRFAIEVTEPTKRSTFLGIESLVPTPVRMQTASAWGAAAGELHDLLVRKLVGASEDAPLDALVVRARRELRT